MMRRMTIGWKILVAVLMVAALAGLSLRGRLTVPRHHAVPRELEVTANVVGYPEEVRYFPRDPGDIKLMTKEFADSWDREKAYLHTKVLPPASYLAISGGSDN